MIGNCKIKINIQMDRHIDKHTQVVKNQQMDYQIDRYEDNEQMQCPTLFK